MENMNIRRKKQQQKNNNCMLKAVENTFSGHIL